MVHCASENAGACSHSLCSWLHFEPTVVPNGLAVAQASSEISGAFLAFPELNGTAPQGIGLDILAHSMCEDSYTAGAHIYS